MVQSIALLIALSCPAALLAAPADVGAFSAEVTPGAGPNQVFPPLPPSVTLPAVAMVDGASARGASGRLGRKSRHVVARKAVEPPIRIVVTDASRTYLATLERQLDDALTRGDGSTRVTLTGERPLADR